MVWPRKAGEIDISIAHDERCQTLLKHKIRVISSVITNDETYKPPTLTKTDRKNASSKPALYC